MRSSGGAVSTAKADLLASALRHRAAELSDTTVFVRAETYDEALARLADNRLLDRLADREELVAQGRARAAAPA